MVCSPHQYTLQKIATPYMPAVTYIELKDYLQKPAYQFRPQQEMYTTRVDPLEITSYQPRQQYASRYQNNERQRTTEENILFVAPVWNPAQLEPSRTIPEQSVSSTWKDYGLPLYRAPSVVKEINKQQPEEDKIKRDDLMQRIRQELAVMNTMNTEKRMEDYLCAA